MKGAGWSNGLVRSFTSRERDIAGWLGLGPQHPLQHA
jgi:hypothetical protein